MAAYTFTAVLPASTDLTNAAPSHAGNNKSEASKQYLNS